MEDPVLGSIDVVTLYPSLCSKESAQVVARIMKDYVPHMPDVRRDEAARYLAPTCTPEEIANMGLSD
jgi:hypothetical protein